MNGRNTDELNHVYEDINGNDRTRLNLVRRRSSDNRGVRQNQPQPRPNNDDTNFNYEDRHGQDSTRVGLNRRIRTDNQPAPRRRHGDDGSDSSGSSGSSDNDDNDNNSRDKVRFNYEDVNGPDITKLNLERDKRGSNNNQRPNPRPINPVPNPVPRPNPGPGGNDQDNANFEYENVDGNDLTRLRLNRRRSNPAVGAPGGRNRDETDFNYENRDANGLTRLSMTRNRNNGADGQQPNPPQPIPQPVPQPQRGNNRDETDFNYENRDANGLTRLSMTRNRNNGAGGQQPNRPQPVPQPQGARDRDETDFNYENVEGANSTRLSFTRRKSNPAIGNNNQGRQGGGGNGGQGGNGGGNGGGKGSGSGKSCGFKDQENGCRPIMCSRRPIADEDFVYENIDKDLGAKIVVTVSKQSLTKEEEDQEEAPRPAMQMNAATRSALMNEAIQNYMRGRTAQTPKNITFKQ